MRKSLAILFFVFCAFTGMAQNLDKIGQKDMLTIHGGLGFNFVNYFSDGMTARRDPFAWYANGNLTISLLDVAIPLSYSWSNQGGKFTQPFNQFSLHPTYKWIKTHIGYSSMSFSPYTLAGHLFMGGGVELSPGKWTIAAMGGRLNKPIAYDALSDNLDNITYRRFGYGIKSGYNWGKHQLQVVAFKAWDDEQSLEYVPLNSTVHPQENLALSIGGKVTLIKHLSIEGEYAISGLTNNVRDTFSSETTNFGSFPQKIIRVNNTTSYYNACKASLGYQWKKIKLQAGFERVDPGYKTLGAYFFNSDLENYTLMPSANLWKGKLMISLNTGFQRNNLMADKAATTKRWVGSANVALMPAKGMNVTLNYSNFSSFTRNRPMLDPFFSPVTDTLNFYQVNQNASLAWSYGFGKNDLKQTVQFTINYSQSSNINGALNNAGAFGMSIPKGEVSDVYNGNVGWSIRSAKHKNSITLSANGNYSIVSTGSQAFIGPSLMYMHPLAKNKVQFQAGSVYNRQYSASELIAHVMNHRISLSYKPSLKKKEWGNVAFSLNANWLQKLSVSGTSPFNEINVFTNINYNF